MFAVVRTGGKQYRVTAGDKIVVEKLSGNAGDKIDITDILLAGEGSDLKPVAGLTVAAEIVAQAKGEKVTVFKKRRRHNYRRKAGHRQQMTLLRIVAVGEGKPAAKKAATAKTEEAPKAEAAPKAAPKAKATEPAKGVDVVKETKAKKAAPVKDGAASKPADEKPVPSKAEGAPAKKPAAKKPAAKK